jgi:transposase-like protein
MMEGLELARKRREEGMSEERGSVPRRGDRTGEVGVSSMPDPEVSERPLRRRFTKEYKLRILREADRCTKPGELGALLRREGVYHSSLSTWRRQRREGTLSALGSKKRGRKCKDEASREIKRLRRENQRLQKELDQAKSVIEVQKKLSDLLGIVLPETTEEE